MGREVLPEVVYAYGLKEAIDKGFLKKVTLHGYANTRTDEFVDIAIENFLKESGELRPEGLLPKLAFFASTVEELTVELKPAVERALLKHGIPTSRCKTACKTFQISGVISVQKLPPWVV